MLQLQHSLVSFIILGCIPSIPGLKLNSRTFNIVLETHPFTCQYHRTIREVERQFIKSIPRKSCTKKRRTFLPYLSEDDKEERGLSVYEMSTDSEHEEVYILFKFTGEISFYQKYFALIVVADHLFGCEFQIISRVKC